MTIGTTLSGRYRLDRELGAGAMATVYLGEDLKHNRPVAVKVLRAELASTLAAERFLREIAILGQLLHPHILGLFDSGETSDTIFYVMPYVEGESLRARLAREGAASTADTIRILREVLDALAYAHDRGIVHRDIKPENVMLTAAVSPASRTHALVADFGIAKAFEAAGKPERSGLTSLGVSLGTPAYMAPEQVAADPAVDHRADLYAVGVLAYELLTGSQPFAAASPQQVMAAHLTRTPDPAVLHRAKVPAALEQIVMRCLHKNAAERFQSAHEILERLENVSGGGWSTTPAAEMERRLAERTFRLGEDVVRTLNRDRLDPRMIDDSVSYLDNEVPSDVLLCFIHGTGMDQSQSERYLRELPYRAIAPTLFGFEPDRRRRIPLVLEDHMAILRAVLNDVVAQSRARRCVLVGLSSGGDIALRMMAATPAESMVVHGVLTLGANLSLDTCWGTMLYSRLGDESSAGILQDLQRLGAGLRTLDHWISVYSYLVNTIRKMRSDVSAVRQFSHDIVQPFAEAAALPKSQSPFVRWYHEVTDRVKYLRCVFEDDPACDEALAAIRLAHLDSGVLGPRHRADGIVIEPQTMHFDLFRPELLYRHLNAVIAEVAWALTR